MALKAAFFHEVTMFHPMRPLVRWSSVEKRFARRNGGSNEVEAVIPNARFLVTAAMAEMGYSVSIHLALGIMGAYNCRISDRPLRCTPDTFV